MKKEKYDKGELVHQAMVEQGENQKFEDFKSFT